MDIKRLKTISANRQSFPIRDIGPCCAVGMKWEVEITLQWRRGIGTPLTRLERNSTEGQMETNTTIDQNASITLILIKQKQKYIQISTCLNEVVLLIQKTPRRQWGTDDIKAVEWSVADWPVANWPVAVWPVADCPVADTECDVPQLTWHDNCRSRGVHCHLWSPAIFEN